MGVAPNLRTRRAPGRAVAQYNEEFRAGVRSAIPCGTPTLASVNPCELTVSRSLSGTPAPVRSQFREVVVRDGGTVGVDMRRGHGPALGLGRPVNANTLVCTTSSCEPVVMVLSPSAQRLRDCYTEGVAAYAFGRRASSLYYVADGGPRARAEAVLWMAGWRHNVPTVEPATVPGECVW